METKRYFDHVRSRMWLPAISLLLLSSFSGVAQRNEVKATGPKVNFCDLLPPNVTFTGSFAITTPKSPARGGGGTGTYGASSCPDLFRIRWVNAKNTYVHSVPTKEGDFKYVVACNGTEIRQIVHRENLDTAARGATPHFTLISDEKAYCKWLPGTPNDVCNCQGGVKAAVDKGANYRVYVSCLEKASASSIPKQCEFDTWTDDKASTSSR